MNAIELQTCHNAALRARRKTEKIQRHNRSLFDKDLTGLCGVASVILWKELKKDKITAQIIANDEHAFVMYKGHILDVTATQFSRSNPQVLIKPRPMQGNESWWCIQDKFRSAKSFMEYQKSVDWPGEQIFLDYAHLVR